MRALRNRVSVVLCSSAIAAVGWLLWTPPVRAQAAAAPAAAQNLPIEFFDKMMTELSNCGRWGKDDQKGAVNLITPAKRKQALSLVKDGISVSMARTAEMEPAIGSPLNPIADVLKTAQIPRLQFCASPSSVPPLRQ